MLNIGLFVFGLVLIALSVGFKLPSRDSAWAFVTGLGGALALVFAGVLALLFPSRKLTLVEKLVAVLRPVALIVGVLFIIGALVSSPSSSADPRSALDLAIRDYQSSVGLDPDGVFGRDTVKAYYGR